MVAAVPTTAAHQHAQQGGTKAAIGLAAPTTRSRVEVGTAAGQRRSMAMVVVGRKACHTHTARPHRTAARVVVMRRPSPPEGPASPAPGHRRDHRCRLRLRRCPRRHPETGQAGRSWSGPARPPRSSAHAARYLWSDQLQFRPGSKPPGTAAAVAAPGPLLPHPLLLQRCWGPPQQPTSWRWSRCPGRGHPTRPLLHHHPPPHPLSWLLAAPPECRSRPPHPAPAAQTRRRRWTRQTRRRRHRPPVGCTPPAARAGSYPRRSRAPAPHTCPRSRPRNPCTLRGSPRRCWCEPWCQSPSR